jgi:hypothetical protein
MGAASLSPCIEYFISPDGGWTLFSVERNLPAGFVLALALCGRTPRYQPIGEGIARLGVAIG